MTGRARLCWAIASGALLWAGCAQAAEQPVLLSRSEDHTLFLDEVRSSPDRPSNFQVKIRIEFLSPKDFGPRGERSIISDVVVNCLARRVLTQQTQAFTGANGQGLLSTTPGDRQWVEAEEGGDTAVLVASLCNAGGLQAVTVSAASPTTIKASPPPPPSPPPKPARPAAPAPPFAVAAVAHVPVKPPPEPGDRRLAVQLSASTSLQEAKASAARAERQFLKPGDAWSAGVESAVVNGVLYYRTVLRGFTSADQARSVCAAVKASGGGCFLREGARQPRAARSARDTRPAPRGGLR